jgi:hypothetical protein
MQCDEYLPWLESGGAQAEAARRHADECPSCRAAAAMLERVKAELSTGEQMPAAMRAAMLGAAERELQAGSGEIERQAAALPPIDSPSRRPLWFAAIAASLVGAALGLWWQLRKGDQIARPHEPQPTPAIQTADVRRVGPITVMTTDPGQELAALADELAALERTLAEAKAGAERLAVAQAVDRVLTDYQRTLAVRR